MSTTLHITNGDSFTAVLKKLDIKGEIVTWREMLCEGKTTNDVGSESFWRQRFEFLNSSYKITKNTFIDLTLKEYRNLCNQKTQDEIILWFEYDLFCQVNLIAVLSWLKKHRRNANIFLVSSGHEPGADKLKGLSELSEKRLKELYENRVELTRDDIEYADYIWQLYCENNPIRLQKAVKLNPQTNLIYLSDAIQAHIQRFPSVRNGLNYQENKMLQVSLNNQLSTKRDLVGKMLEDQGFYGFGDIQYEKMADRLKPMFQSMKPVKLNKFGKEVFEKVQNCYPILRNEKEYLGGTPKYSFLFLEETAQLLKL